MSTIVPNVKEQYTQHCVQLSPTLSIFYKTRSFAVCSIVQILLLSVRNYFSVLIFLFVVQSDVRARRTLCTSDTPHYENVPFEVPKGWCVVSLSELFMLNPKNEIDDNAEVGFIPMTNVEDGFSGDHTFEVREWKGVKKGYCHFQNGDIGVAKISPCFENLKSCIFHSLPNGFGAGTTELVILRSMGVYSPFYLYLFKSTWYISQGTKYFKGVVGQQRVNKAIFTELEVPLPSYGEQQRIVAEIEKWFALIDIIESGKTDLQTTIKQAKRKILDLAIHGNLVPQDPNDEPAYELLKRINPKAELTCDNGQYGKMPKGWCLVTGTSLFKQMKSAKPKGELFKYIDIDSVDNKSNIVSSIKEIPTIEAPSRASRYTEKGDVVFSMVRPYLRNIARITENDCIASTGFYICSPYNCMLSKFCYYLMLSNYVVDGLNTFMKGDNSPSITKREIENWLYPLPPMNEQYRIVAKIEKIFTILDRIELSLRMS